MGSHTKNLKYNSETVLLLLEKLRNGQHGPRAVQGFKGNFQLPTIFEIEPIEDAGLRPCGNRPISDVIWPILAPNLISELMCLYTSSVKKF